MTLDPQTLIAQLGSVVGNSIALYFLEKDGAKAVVPLQNLAALLPNVALGKVNSFQMGQLVAQLEAMGASATKAAQPQPFLDQLAAAVALVSQSQAASGGGDITITQALLSAAAQNLANGINAACQYFLGQQSVLAPTPAPASS